MSTSKPKAVLKRNKKLDMIYHPDSGLVFKSSKNKVVTGRIVDGEFISLDEEALDLCEQYGFKYDETLVDDGSESEQEAEKESDGDSDSDSDNEDNEDNEDNNQNDKEDNKEVEKPSEPEKEPEKESENDTKSTPTEKLDFQINNVLVVPTPDPLELFKKTVRRHNEELNNLFVSVSEQNNNNQNNQELESELEYLRKELSDAKQELDDTKQELQTTKKKLKGVLTAMQGEL